MDMSKTNSVHNRFTMRGFPYFIDVDSKAIYTFNITCARGQPSPKHLRVSDGCLITRVPGTYFSPPLEFGDHILMINGERVEGQLHFYQLLQEAADSAENNHTLQVTVERILFLKKLDRKSKLLAPGTVSDGYNYFLGQLVFFPKAALGVSIKSICKKFLTRIPLELRNSGWEIVGRTDFPNLGYSPGSALSLLIWVFVESTDNGLASIGRRVFYIGDRIVTVNGCRCESAVQAKEWIIDTLKRENIVSIVLERAESSVAVKQVQMALAISKAPTENRRLPKDVIAILRTEVERIMREIENPDSLTPILRASDPFTTSNVTFSNYAIKMRIGMEPTNPAMLAHATGLFNSNMQSKKKKHSRKSKSLGAKSPSPTKLNEQAGD